MCEYKKRDECKNNTTLTLTQSRISALCGTCICLVTEVETQPQKAWQWHSTGFTLMSAETYVIKGQICSM